MLTLTILALLGCTYPPEPLPTPTEPEAPQALPPPPPTIEAIDEALGRSASWARSYPEPLAFDAHLSSYAIATLSKHPDWVALDAERRSVQSDTDHEHTRFWDPEATLDRAYVHRWTAPTDGSRINPNRVVTEALYCADHGLRPQTLSYLCGPMRDEGGYHSTHALWALHLAEQAGCPSQPDCTEELTRELVAAQPHPFEPVDTQSIDLYAERLLMTCLVSDCQDHALQTQQLLLLQLQDGSFRVPGTQDSRYEYHATALASWALSAWRSKNPESHGDRP